MTRIGTRILIGSLIAGAPCLNDPIATAGGTTKGTTTEARTLADITGITAAESHVVCIITASCFGWSLA